MGRHPVAFRPLLLALAFLAPAATAEPLTNVPDGVHSYHVLAIDQDPIAPARGHDVRVILSVVEDSEIHEIGFTYCRAERYACAPAQIMEQRTNDSFAGTVKWDPAFFKGVRNVGYKFTIRFSNESDEQSPLQHWPSKPEALPPDAGIYYWYGLPAEARAPAAGAALVLAAMAAAALAGRRATEG